MIQKTYEVVFKKSASKELLSLPRRIQQKILDSVQLLSLNPYTELLQIKNLFYLFNTGSIQNGFFRK